MNSEYLDRIEHPAPRTLEQLRDKAIQNVKETLPNRSVDVHDPAVFRKLAFTYYYDWESDDPSYMMVSEDPGGIQSRHTSDLIDFAELSGDDPLEQVSIYRDFASRWLGSDNTRFAESFFGACADEGLIGFDQSARAYARSGEFFDDFYLTDVNKYRASASTSREIGSLTAYFTAPELHTADPDLIFAFGNDAWDVLSRELALSPVEADHNPTPDAGITAIDGHLYRSQRLIETHVVPLLHMSGQAFGAQRSPNEYADRIKQAVRIWKQVT